ncbi:hypothetical protein B005_3865 [Nocardiopsis alba ATCC BAA-2165]|uniref:Uncharacterized protein n=1 Tax=Nocardiopsis alba (strain ATCC BAA-2165 / BE74) TaxID=1205910 RepID=J7L308_NOCAA|nr:hypothetical protein B005_3865 [Nocardiopsis alba ATCC BAA-2165]
MTLREGQGVRSGGGGRPGIVALSGFSSSSGGFRGVRT